MPTLTISINVEVDVNYGLRNTEMTDQEIADEVCKYIEEERNDLAREARVAAIRLLNGENLSAED